MDHLPCTIFYCLSALLMAIGAGAIWSGRHRPGEERAYRAGMLSAVVVAVSLLSLVWLSLRFDFGDCPYPSRGYPYFTSGRLIYGMLVPVLALFLNGVVAVTRRRKPATAIILGVTVVMMVFPQVAFFAQILKSPYNWFHIP